jgi:hypothetical protein
MAAFLNWLPLLLRRRKREQSLDVAATWPTITAKLLKSTVLEKDPLAEEGTAFQDRQVESAYFFTLEGSYYGGHLRSVPMADSEAHRALKLAPEDTPVQVRYNPANPDQVHTLPGDNANFPFEIWPS